MVQRLDVHRWRRWSGNVHYYYEEYVWKMTAYRDGRLGNLGNGQECLLVRGWHRTLVLQH